MEMIPLAYPSGGAPSPDLSLGHRFAGRRLAGWTSRSAPPSTASWRTIQGRPTTERRSSSPRATDGGAQAVTITVPLYRALATGEAAKVGASSFSAATGTWPAEPGAIVTNPRVVFPPGDAGASIQVDWTLSCPHLTWWSAMLPNPGVTCVSGKINVAGGTAA